MLYASTIIALLALLISFLAYRKAGQAFDHTKATTSALNTPVLSFEVTTTRTDGVRAMMQIEISIHNGGKYPTEITEGQIALQSHEYPEAEKPRKLAGWQVFSGIPRTVKIEVKQAIVYRPRPEIPATELVCDAVSKRFEQQNGEAHERY